MSHSEDKVNVHETYLELLGFYSNAGLYPQNVDKSLNLPVIVTGTTSADSKIFKLIESVRKYQSERLLLIYDLGLNSVDLVQVPL